MIKLVFSCCFFTLIVLVVGCNQNCLNGWVKKNTDSSLAVSKRIITGQLDNGIKYYFMSNANPKDRCFLRLNIAAGSFNESDTELGMAHMVEHLAFSDRAVAKDESLSAWLQKHGMSIGADANAYTSSEHTVYQFNLPSCRHQDVLDGLRILRSFADGLSFADDAIAKEKNIIDAEEREYENTHGKLAKRLIDRLLSGTLHSSRPVLGNKEVRAQFTKESITAFYRKWYRPKNMAIALVGDYKDMAPKDMIESIFSSIEAQTSPTKKITSPPPDHRHQAFILHEAEMPHVETIFAVQPKRMQKPRFDRSLLKERLSFELALDMLRTKYASKSKESQNMLREPTLSGTMLDIGVYDLTLSTTGQMNDFEMPFTDAFMALRHGAEIGFADEEFLKAKATFFESLSQWVVAEETYESASWITRILGHINQTAHLSDAHTYETLALPVLEDITAQDCKRAIKQALVSGNRYIFAVGAIKETASNVRLLATLLEQAQTKKMAKEKAPVPIAFHYQLPVCPKTSALTQQHMANIDSYKVKLANGIEVLLKPTKFKKDEILLRIFTDDGYRAIKELDFNLARIATSVLLEGGLTHHPPEQMPILMQDKLVNSSLSLFSNRLQANLLTRAKDLRFALELVRAYITDPLYATTSLQRIKEQVKNGYAMLAHDMWAPLNHEYLRSITNNDFRVGRAALADILNTSRDDLLAWHHRHLTGKKLYVVVVGDFELDHMAQEVACVFSSLPTHEKLATKSGRALAFKSGVDNTYEIETKDETSKLALRYPLNFNNGNKKDHRLSILSAIVQEKLRLKLREKAQITYSPSVEVVENADPLMQNWLDVVVLVPKEQGEPIRKKIKEVLAKLSKMGTSSSDLLKAQEPYLTKMTAALHENSFWADVLSSNFEAIDSLHWLSTIDPDIKSIKVGEINKLLGQYLIQKNASSALVNAVAGHKS